MEMVKNIAAILGVVLSATTVIALVSKSARAIIRKVFKKYGKDSELSRGISELKDILEKHIEEDKSFKETTTAMNQINLEFIRTQCRKNIKNIFYRYKDTRILPLYEKKTLANIESLYIDKLHCNSYASLLLDEMRDWAVDYDPNSEV